MTSAHTDRPLTDLKSIYTYHTIIVFWGGVIGIRALYKFHDVLGLRHIQVDAGCGPSTAACLCSCRASFMEAAVTLLMCLRWSGGG